MFQSTHPVWGATLAAQPPGPPRRNFNPRTPCGVRRVQVGHIIQATVISIHAPRVGCDSVPTSVSSANRRFQSTHPVWGATPRPGRRIYTSSFQSTHPVWGATSRSVLRISWPPRFQSTHPVWGATASASCSICPLSLFQSTHPVWGATFLHTVNTAYQKFQSTHPVWGATSRWRRRPRPGRYFNPRTPCGVRHIFDAAIDAHGNFNPRTPCGVRLVGSADSQTSREISIHAPRVGCDVIPSGFLSTENDFNPRTPCGVRPCNMRRIDHGKNFNPRTPCGVRQTSL